MNIKKAIADLTPTAIFSLAFALLYGICSVVLYLADRYTFGGGATAVIVSELLAAVIRDLYVRWRARREAVKP